MNPYPRSFTVPRGIEVVVARRLATLNAAGVRLDPGVRILDLGCGAGDTVAALLNRGYDAVGCDLKFRPGPNLELLQREARLAEIELEPYRLPYPDASFDLVVSDQVMEHVQDYASTIAEVARVTKPGSYGLHVFPSRWRLIEAHLDVPLAGAIQNRAWLGLWARLGVRNEFQKENTLQQTIDNNVRYLAERTNYLPRRAILDAFGVHFERAEYLERPFLEASAKTRRLVSLPLIGSILASLYHTFGMRVLLVRRAG